MYNSVHLKEENWCFQRYIWQNEFDERKLPEEKEVKKLIYWVKSNVNQSERGLRETAKLSGKDYPEVNHIVHKYIHICR